MEPNHELPPVEGIPHPTPSKGIESSPVAPEKIGNLQPLTPPTTQPIMPPPIPAALPVPGLQSLSSTPPSTPITDMIADDADLIEKEWVQKAKSIVAQTAQDPHTQNKEMSKLKAQYVKTRYNKDFKLSEG